MKTLDIRFLEFLNEPDINSLSAELDKIGPGEKIDIINCETFSYKPEVRFNIAYTSRELLLKYYVREEFVKAEMTGSDQAVWEDSCVEFFFSPSDDGIYYNLEVNPIGTCLLASGPGRTGRTRSENQIINKIRRYGSLGSEPFKERAGDNFWTITLAIPFEVFHLHNFNTLKNRTCKANFYKCGDKLSRPHYLSWNTINTPKPDFHRPEFFGILRFI